MHQALPPRKASQPPIYARSSLSSYRRKRLKAIGLIACAIITVYFIIAKLLSTSEEHIPSGTPDVVIVTVLDPDIGSQYLVKIKDNRDNYAAKHGTDLPSNLY